MSYNIFSKRAAFQGTTKTADGDIVSGTIEYMVDNHSNQTIDGQKTFTDLSASNISIGERISHTGDSDTRLQFGTDNIAFMADGGTQIFTIYGNLNPDRVQVNTGNLVIATGNIGIGVTVPTFELEVDGNVSGSGTFHNVGAATFGNNLSVTGTISGNGSGLTNVGLAGNLLAESIIGSVSGSQISASNGLSTSGNNLVVQVSGTASGLASETNGIKIDLTGLGTVAYSDNDHILISSSAGNKKMQLGTLESGFDSLAAGQVTSGRFDTARLPTTISGISFLTSSVISASTFHGNGENLTGVSATAAPGGSNTQVQFNDDGDLTGDAQLFFLTGSNTLATTALSASGDLSGSSLRILNSIFTGGNTFLDSNGNVFASSISGSGTIHVVGSASFGNDLSITGAYFGDGRQLTGLPITNAASNAVVTVVNATTKTVDASSDFTYDGTDLEVQNGAVLATNLSASSDLKAGGNLVIGVAATTLSATELGVLDGVTAGTAAASKAMVLDSNADITGFRKLISATNGASLVEVTSSAGKISLSGEAVAIRNVANTSVFNVAITDGDVTSAGAIKAASLSASADLQVGGHITGSGNIVLSNNNNNRIEWDLSGGSDEGPYIHGVSSSSGVGHTKKLEIHGDNDLNLLADSIIRFKVPDNANAVTIESALATVSVPISSSSQISGSGLYLQSHGTTVIASGGNTFLDSDGGITVGAITMMADSDTTLNFNNNQISGSGHISGSAFYFEDSINLSGNPIITGDGNASFGQLTCFVDAKGNTNLPTDNSRATFYVDESANKFFVYVKYSGGAVKSGSIDLT
jgi:hypothetical protein